MHDLYIGDPAPALEFRELGAELRLVPVVDREPVEGLAAQPRRRQVGLLVGEELRAAGNPDGGAPRLARSYKRNTRPSLIGVGRVNPGGIDPIEAPVAQHVWIPKRSCIGDRGTSLIERQT